MPGHLEFEFGIRNHAASPKPSRREHMRVLVLGDFSGHGHRNSANHMEIGPPIAIDIDNFDDVMRRISPRLTIPAANGDNITITFSQLEDFHPDALLANVDCFRALSDLRRRLLNPTTFTQAVAELGHPIPTPEIQRTTPAPSHDTSTEESQASMFERLLGKPARSGTGSKETTQTAPDVARLIAHIVEPHITSAPNASQSHYAAAVDQAICQQLRQLLHHPHFQALEAGWRSIHSLVTRWPGTSTTYVQLLDISKDELAKHLVGAENELTNTAIYQQLTAPSIGQADDKPCTMIIGNFSFSADAQDRELLAALGQIARQTGGPFLAAAHPALIGRRSFANSPITAHDFTQDEQTMAAWRSLRQSDIAPWIGLALPRVLLRLPYGQGTEAVEYLAFEELEPSDNHESYLWGNPAFACALMIAMTTQPSDGTAMPEAMPEIDDLPVHSCEQDGEHHIVTGAEILLPAQTAEKLLELGLIPLVNFRDRNALTALRLQSIADPPQRLAGL